MRLLSTVILLGLVSAGGATFAAKFDAIKGTDLLSGQAMEFAPGPEKKFFVVTFLSSKCPCSNSHVAILKKLAAEHPRFSFIAVHSNADEAADQAQAYFRRADLGFPVLQDDNTALADRFHALKTPHAFVIDENGQILYQGGVTSSNNGPRADKQYLRDALDDIEAGRPVKVPEARTLGCVIAR